jgi:hypothetical protein
MKKYVSISLLFILFALLVFAIFKKKHAVYSLKDGNKSEKNGYEFTEETTYDGLMLRQKDGKVYDVYSLTPDSLQEKDCPT